MSTGGEETRIGIYLCGCGGNISDVIDVESIRETVKSWGKVVTARYDSYLCSKPSQDTVYEDIKNYELNRVIVVSCSPRMHLSTFKDLLERAGLNSYLLEFVNIREQCSWVHGPEKSKEATAKAVSLVRSGYERSLQLEPLQVLVEEVSQEVLVVGGGVAGITASLELEGQGFRVHLVEKLPSIGGQMAKLTKVFPTLDCAQCIITPKIAKVGTRRKINLLTYSELEKVEGRPGNYTVRVFRKPRGVNVQDCRGCGVCSIVCPVSCPDEFNEGRSLRKAAYIPFPQAMPFVYTIDFDHCTRCGKCVESCPSSAINLNDEGELVTINVGSIVVATGYEEFQAEKLSEYGFGVYPDVITMLELERLTSLFGPSNGKVVKFSDGGDVGNVAMVLCAGSRDRNQYIPYCSRICCMYSLKQAIILKETLDIDVKVYYTDIRATGRGYEELYWRAQEAGVLFIRGKAAEVWREKGSDSLIVRAEDTLTGTVTEEEFDMVALAVAMVPPEGFAQFADSFSLPLGGDGFVQELHPKLDPVNTIRPGVHACGCALGPKDVRDTVSDSLAAASKTASFLKEGTTSTSPEKAFVEQSLCNGCQACIAACPVSAITLMEEKAYVDPFICTGCGGCVPECPAGAIDVKNSTIDQIIASLTGILNGKEKNEVRLIAFVDKSIGYTGVDFLGLDRSSYPRSIRVIPVPTTAIISFEHILHAFSLGADGVLILEGDKMISECFTNGRIKGFSEALEEIGVDSMRLYYSLVQLPSYKNIKRIFDLNNSIIEDLEPMEPETIEAIKRKLKK